MVTALETTHMLDKVSNVIVRFFMHMDVNEENLAKCISE